MKIAKEEHVDEQLLRAICYVESKYNVSSIAYMDGNSHSYGVCQLKYETAKYMGYEGLRKNIMNVETNIRYSAKYLRYQTIRYKGDSVKAVAAYNAGHYKLGRNSQYIEKVFNAYLQKR